VVIRSRAPVLLLGPTGAGKSQLTQRIYELKKPRHQLDGQLVEVNCATLSGDNAMSALFGHQRGAFTGAATQRQGLLRAAETGMLFLDEVGELGLDEQAMMLRAVENKQFLPMGADQEVSSNFQLIAGTNRDLRAECSKGNFREDLLARLDLWTFALPSLRERPEDIPSNVEFELRRFGHASGENERFSGAAGVTYLDFATSAQALWRSNFRDLRASITRMSTLAESGRITQALVSEEIARLQRAWSAHPSAPVDAIPEQLKGRVDVADLDRFEGVQRQDVLRVCTSARSLSEATRTVFVITIAA